MATFFESAAAFRTWLDEHASTASELVVGFHKKSSGRPSIRWPEAVDEALCVGWIDGVRHRLDDVSYQIRFTPRKVGSTWSAVNIDRVSVLEAEGRMRPAGILAFSRRKEKRSRIYSYEQAAAAELAPAEAERFREHGPAWSHFEVQPPGYRRNMIWWIVSAKRPETRSARLSRLIEASEAGRRL